MQIPLDSDGFMRRECPNCEQQFKWRLSQTDDPVEHVDQYYCPLCGQAAGVDSWWTREQVEHAQAVIRPEAMRQVQDMLSDAFRGNKNIRFKPSGHLADMPTPSALYEPDDMVILEPPCHTAEPVKVPEGAEAPFYCLICGEPYAA